MSVEGLDEERPTEEKAEESPVVATEKPLNATRVALSIDPGDEGKQPEKKEPEKFMTADVLTGYFKGLADQESAPFSDDPLSPESVQVISDGELALPPPPPDWDGEIIAQGVSRDAAREAQSKIARVVEFKSRKEAVSAVQGSRPQAPQEPLFRTGAEILAMNVAPQVGTSPKVLADGEYDMRLLTDFTPETQVADVYFSLRSLKTKCYKRLVDANRYTAPAIGGKRVRTLLEFQRASNPMFQPTPPKVAVPNIVARNVWDRKWKEKQELQLG